MTLPLDRQAHPSDDRTEHTSNALRELTRSVAWGSGFIFAGGVFGKVLSFALQILLSRTLGTVLYGLYSLGLTVVRFLREIAALGLQSGVIRFGTVEWNQRNERKLKGTLLSSLGISTAVSVLIGAALYLTADPVATGIFNDPALSPALKWFAAALPFYVILYISSRVTRAFQKLHLDAGLRDLLQPGLNLVFVAGAFLIGYRLQGALLGFFLSALISAGLGVYLVWSIFPGLFSRRPGNYRPIRLLKFSLPILGASLATLLLALTDRLMLGALSTSESVGIYTAAAATASQLRFALYAVNASFSPVISDLYHRGQREHLQMLFTTTTRWVISFSLPLLALFVLLSEPIMRIYGPGFASGSAILIVLAFTFFIDGGVGAAGQMLQMSDNQHIVMINNVTIAIMNIGLNLWLIPDMGMMGAAIATGSSIAAGNLAKLIEVIWLLRMHPYDWSYLKPFSAALLSLLAGGIILHVLPSPWSWFSAAATIGIIYLLAMYVFGRSPGDDIIIAEIKKHLPWFR